MPFAPPSKRPVHCLPMKADLSSGNERAFSAVEHMLNHLHGEVNAAKAAEEIRFRFGSGNAMFAANRQLWQDLGVSSGDALLFSRIMEIARSAYRSGFSANPRLRYLKESCDYLSSSFYGLQVERFYMFCLDRRGYLKERVFLHEGTADSALFSLNHLLSEAVRVSPAALILCHNHPAETLRPSPDDLNSTMDALQALRVVGIPMLDHIVIAGPHAVSIRSAGFIPNEKWLSQAPENSLLKHWLDGSEEL